jgi:tetratricopeptide (TPR) repeat protein
VIDYQVRIAFEGRQWDTAERLQSARVSHSRSRAAEALSSPVEQLDSELTGRIKSLAVALGELALIQREQGKRECFAGFDEARRLLQHIGDGVGEAVHCLNLGVAYLTLERPPNLKEAESCFQRGLQLTPDRDGLGRSKFLSELGFIEQERMNLAIEKQNASESVKHLTNAIRLYEDALELMPEDAVASLAIKHQALGDLYRRANLIDRSIEHTRDAIRYHERDGNRYGVAATNVNMALSLYEAGRLLDAKEYAEAGLSIFESYGPQAAHLISHTRRVLDLIEETLQQQGN